MSDNAEYIWVIRDCDTEEYYYYDTYGEAVNTLIKNFIDYISEGKVIDYTLTSFIKDLKHIMEDNFLWNRFFIFPILKGSKDNFDFN